MVQEKGKCGTFYCDIKKLMDTHPSAYVEDPDWDDEILTPEVFEAQEIGSKKRKASVVATEKIHKESLPEPEDSVADPPPRRNPRKTNTAHPCVICLDEQASFLVKPCGHLAYCASCADNVKTMALTPPCPMCRKSSEGLMRVYFS